MKSFKKELCLLLIVAFTWSCQKETGNDPTQTNDDLELIMPSIVREGKFDIVPWDNNSALKSTQASAQFTDGGMAMIAGQFFPTVIIGNQRWTIMDFKGTISDPSLSYWDKITYGEITPLDTTRYYSYNAAMTLNGSPTLLNLYAPAGLTEVSNWRIPTWEDESDLYQMAQGDETAINTAMDFNANGMIYHTYSSSHIPTADTIPVLYNPTVAVHWNADYLPYNGSYGTWHLTGSNTVDDFYLFQFQLMLPYAPIRLVQNINPL
ncbi:MAG: hypothetical protein QM786_07370 [Breznakibacter sp.]